MKDFFDKYGDRISVNPETGCWEWDGARISAGHGHFNRDGEHHYAHRAAFEYLHGEGSADGLVVRHECDNPPCCNPFHLLGGTQADNVADMVERGRLNPARGEANGGAVLTEAVVIEARSLAAEGWGARRLSKRFNCGKNTMAAVLSGRTWAHVGGAA